MKSALLGFILGLALLCPVFAQIFVVAPSTGGSSGSSGAANPILYLPWNDIFIPELPPSGGNPPDNSANAVDSSQQRFGSIIRAPKAGTIDAVQFYVSAVTTPQTMRWSIQGITNGNPNGTITHFGTFTPAVGWTTVVLTSDGTGAGTKRTVTLNEQLAFVLDYTGTAPVGVQIRYMTTTSGHQRVTQDWSGPYLGFWLMGNSTYAPFMALRYTDNSLAAPRGWLPVTGFPAGPTAFANNAEGGAEFTLPSTVTARGAWIATAQPTGQIGQLRLYEGTTLTATVNVVNLPRNGVMVLYFDAAVQIKKDTTYRIVTSTTGSGQSMYLYYMNIPTTDYRALLPIGDRWYYVSRANTGAAFTTDPLRWPMIGLIL